MGKCKGAILTALGALTIGMLTGCGTVVDERIMNTEANYSVDISVPYATPTPLPEYLNVPDAIVIDSDGNVTLNDASIIEGDFSSAREEESQTEYRTLARGATGIAVQALQSRLAELGYYEGEISGSYDPDTENAVKRFEQTFGTMQTGVATQKLQLRLFSETAPKYDSAAYREAVVAQYTVLRPGAVGSSVYALQQRLKSLNYPITNLSGAYDAQTAAAVRLFYQAHGIAASDIADVSMQRRLYSEDALPYDPTAQPAVESASTTLEGNYTPTGTMGLGSEGDNVSTVQRRLIALGYMEEGSATGTFDEATQAAVNAFLTSVSRAAVGELSEDMQLFLMSASAPVRDEPEATEYTTLSPGDSGDAVMNLQRRLVELGYANGNPNGNYGTATISAVQLYQALNGMDVDGVASAWLQTSIFSDTARSYQEIQGILPSASPTPTPEPTEAPDALYFNLSVGSSGNAVTRLQERLVALGYTLTANGTYDEPTRMAVSAFQSAIGVSATGEASASLQRYVYSKAAPGPGVYFYNVPQTFASLSLGDTGDAVTRLQQQLFALNLLKQQDVQGSIGTFNEATRQAVITAQRAMGYDSADGVAGVEFQSFLYSRYARKIRQNG